MGFPDSPVPQETKFQHLALGTKWGEAFYSVAHEAPSSLAKKHFSCYSPSYPVILLSLCLFFPCHSPPFVLSFSFSLPLFFDISLCLLSFHTLLISFFSCIFLSFSFPFLPSLPLLFCLSLHCCSLPFFLLFFPPINNHLLLLHLHSLQMLSLLEHMYHDLDLVHEFKINVNILRRFLVNNTHNSFEYSIFFHLILVIFPSVLTLWCFCPRQMCIQANYRNNPFHNFRHCFCVTQMVSLSSPTDSFISITQRTLEPAY